MSRRAPEVAADVVADVVELARRLREMPLRKAPSISEVVDAARAAAVLGDTGTVDTDVQRYLLAALLKYNSDADLASRRLAGEEPAPEVTGVDDRAGWTSPPRARGATTAAFRGRGGRNEPTGRYDALRGRR